SKTGLQLTFDHFYNYAELTQALRTLHQTYPQFMTLKSIGQSYQGRDIWGIILNNPKTGPAEHKPGYYIDGNIHGNEIQGTEVVLYALWWLLTNYGRNELATRLLDEKAFYLVPTVNPDGREIFINEATNPNSPRSGLKPYDEDRDGLADEDSPEDLDRDGSITLMRKKVALGKGTHKLHPDDPRILIPIKPGEKGDYLLLGEEGIDNDGDGLINEDGPGGYDLNRNFGFNWQPEYVQRGAGDFPFCFPETAAIRDFLLAHPNIAGAQSFHNYGGMILRGPGARNMGEYLPADRQVYDYVGKNGEKILPGYRYIVVYKDMYTVYGGTLDFIYNVLGAFTFSNELDLDPIEAQRQRQLREREETPDFRAIMGQIGRLEEIEYHDLVLLGEHFSPWKPYRHPLYGEIEIGGVKKFGRRVPPMFQLAETCHRNAAFCFYHADQLPRLEIEKAEIKKIKANLYQLDLSIVNSRVTPTISAVAIQHKLHRPDEIRLEGKKINLVAAGYLIDEFRGETKPIKIRQNRFQVENGIPGFGRVNFRLLVEAEAEAEVIYSSVKGGLKKKNLFFK
ncbi:MAG: M14 family metallopeptidase, partial [Candidatus Aminicenantes bacterium]|nr:M14 family metallopeptidase [Candidatus Aminicenantes bacterium]